MAVPPFIRCFWPAFSRPLFSPRHSFTAKNHLPNSLPLSLSFILFHSTEKFILFNCVASSPPPVPLAIHAVGQTQLAQTQLAPRRSWPDAVGETQLARRSWLRRSWPQDAVGQTQLARRSWPDAVGSDAVGPKTQLARRSWRDAVGQTQLAPRRSWPDAVGETQLARSAI
ncbi:hypothetical protein niasHT_005320 [Heterodera trifolii]|uniref:Uncharacterized protein n=1 Tax=Heterodera trifolii TaxID=157864 RepID=A0ABD2M2S5_9BILA